MNENLMPEASRLDSLAPRRQQQKGHVTGSPKTWKHHVGDQKRKKKSVAGDNALVPSLHGGALSVADFD
jgi:hypothetical protein